MLKVLLFHNVAASTEHYDCLKKLKFDTLIDVGANNGQFSLLCINFNKNLKVFAFEPITHCFMKYNAIFKNFPLVHSFNVGLGDKSRESLKINISKSKDSSSFLAQKRQQIFFPGTEEISSCKVKLRTLDDYYKRFSKQKNVLLKIDIQGFEKKMLLGSTKSLQYIKYIIIELSFIELYKSQPLFDEIYSFLLNSNFLMKDIIYIYKKNNSLVQGDFLFVNRIHKNEENK